VARTALAAVLVVLLASPAAAGAFADVGSTGDGPAVEGVAVDGGGVEGSAVAGEGVEGSVVDGTSGEVSVATSVEGARSTASEDDTIANVTVTPLEDEDVDGAAAAFRVTIRADTSLDDTDLVGNNPGEPYVEIEIDETDVAELKSLPRSETFVTNVTLTASDLAGFEPGQHDLTVELWDKDGASYDATDLGNDDKLDEETVPVTIERSAMFDLEAGRTSATVGSVVALRALGEFDGDVEWTLVDAPAGSETGVRRLPNGKTASLRPDEPGAYTVRVTSPSGDRTATVTVTAENVSTHRLLRRYAPRLHFHANETYYPTRYEAFVHNAELEDIRSPDDEAPTMFDLQNRGSRWQLDLRGEQSTYPTYDDDFPMTVYGSVHRDVQFRGQNYTAVTYWLFYVYDPKQDDSVAALLGHQSDLETVTILLRGGEPRWVGASQHYGGELREWSTVGRKGTHVSVYPALGAHSNYLRNTREVDGGIPIQQQFINRSSRSTDPVSAPLVDYVDRTGDALVATHDGSEDRAYQVVPLTGDEVWASYAGGLGNEDQGHVPMRRSRWRQPGQWMETSPVPDHRQVSGTLAVRRAAVEDGTVSVRANVSNTGVKPHVFWVFLEARPADADWNGSSVRTLERESVSLGVGQSRQLTVEGATPDGGGEWTYRARLLRYPLDVLDRQDVLGEVPFEAGGARSPTPVTPGETPPSQSGLPWSLVSDAVGVVLLAALLALVVLRTARARL
jgi:hypothetical protein